MARLGIRSRLFLTYTLLVTLVIATLSAFFYTQISNIIWDRSLESSRQMLQRVEASLNQTLRDMDRISAQVIYNSDFQYHFDEADPSHDSYEALQRKKNFESILSTLNGPSFIAEQINVFNFNGNFISYGLQLYPYENIKARIQRTDWIQPAMQMDGGRVLNPPHRDSWFRSGELVFSLSRMFPSSEVNSPQFVEVQQRYDKLQDVVGDAVLQTRNSLYIVDDQGRLFYPYAEDGSAPAFNRAIVSASASDKFQSATELLDGDEYVVSRLRSSVYGLTVVAVQPKSLLLSPVNRLRNVALTVTVAAEILALAIAYWVASSITRPIRTILWSVKRWDLDRLSLNSATFSPGGYRRAAYEIRELYDGFFSLKSRLNQSVDQLLESRQRENLAHMRALQTQLQPHFIFNTLSSIGILAENAGASLAASMSYKMMHMMEYISRTEAESVEWQEELRFTEMYLELMQLRYQDDFRFEIETDGDLTQRRVPKFFLQPIVENSFAHGFKQVYPPWSIRIAVAPEGPDAWSIRIADNGSGFSQDAMDRIQRFLSDLREGRYQKIEEIGAKGIGGMGLENALSRMYLHYDGRVAFSLRNLEEGMELAIVIGGKEESGDV
ncbi:histidine kinase [Cohnella ginsengisoli]|uniref:Histidine kinase n=1 Tax=Cohnella ginsengisoli TaxID=425004 RepID=A0A9X4KFB0_9BACL|nr:sensor histidine kinase [Cohnella ginsengisoli]MDG0790931.1 histidine kinase [Cohnella ginsengisoli]